MTSNLIAVARAEAAELRQWLHGSEHAQQFKRFEGLEAANLREIQSPLRGHPAIERLVDELEAIAALEAEQRRKARVGPKAKPKAVVPAAA